MRIFGRKAKTESTTPSAPVVPPELQPYYDGRTRGAQLRRTVGRLLPLLAAVVLAAVLIGGAVWIRNHRSSPTGVHKPATTTRQSPKKPSSPSTKQPSNPPAPQQGNNPTPTPQSSSGQTGSNAPSNQSPQTPGTPGQPSTVTSTIPNTGPGETALVAALGAGVAATLINYYRQLRRRSTL